MRFINFHVVELLVQPKQDIFVRQPIPHPKGTISLGMIPRVRLLEVGGSTGGTLGKAFVPFTFFCGTQGGLGNTFFPFTSCDGTSGPGGYVTPAVWGSPTLQSGG